MSRYLFRRIGFLAITFFTVVSLVFFMLRLKHAPFIDAARAMGARPAHILAKHVIPSVLGPIVVYTTLAVPYIILAESFISFLGLGIQEPQTSWGVLVADGAQTIETSPWQIIFPGFFLAATIWSCNTLGDTMRDELESRDQVF